jgi:uncharacterized protein YndB with AHSA1/START domain
VTKLRSLRVTFVLGALALVAGCATVPSIPLTDIRAIQGKWRGTITVDMGTPQFYYLTVNPDSTIVAEWGSNWQWGTISLGGGRARFEISHLTSGTLLYFSNPKEGRVITMTPDFGGWYVYVTRLQ